MQTRASDLSYATALQRIVYPSPYLAAPVYPRSPYGMAGLGSNCSIPGPPYCDSYGSYDELIRAFGVENCYPYDVVGDVDGSYQCSVRNKPKEVAVANFQAGCCFSGHSPTDPLVPFTQMVPGTYGNTAWGGGSIYNVNGQPVGTTNLPTTGSTTTTGGSAGGPTVSFTASRSGSVFVPGDSWTISITGGAPNSPVVVSSTHDGSPDSATMGTTNSGGSWSLTGTFDSGVLGNWSETWSVNGVVAGSFSFCVVRAGAGYTSCGGSTIGGGAQATGLPITQNPNGGSTYTAPSGGGGTSYPSPGSSQGGTQIGQQPSGGGYQQPSGGAQQQSPATSAELIAGIPNTALLLGGGALILIMAVAGGR